MFGEIVKFVARFFFLGMLVLGFVFSIIPGQVQAEAIGLDQTENKSILILVSSQYGIPWYMTAVDEIISNLQEIMGENKVDLQVEFSGLETYNSSDYLLTLYDLYRSKYEGAKFDLIISMADIATEFLIQFRDDLFPGTPVVFVAEKEQIEDVPADMTGISETVKIEETLNLALDLHPQTRQIVVISGSGEYDLFYETITEQIFKNYEDRFEFIYFTGLPVEELIDALQQVPENSIIIYLLMMKDKNDQTYIPRSALKEISENVDLPIYGLWDTYLGYGIVGGYLSSAELVGKKIALISEQILNGENPEDIPAEHSFYANIFDWRQLQKWNINKKDLPEDSIVKYEESSFWNLYKRQIILYVLVFIIGMMVYIQYRKQSYQKDIQEQEQVRKLLEKKVKERTADLNRANAELERLSQIDGLTSLHNRRYFDERLKNEWKRHRRNGLTLSLVMCDIDHFKNYNDTYGHQAGDLCLQQVSQILMQNTKRPFDVAARYGGEEFAIILPETCSDGAINIVKDIKMAIEEMKIPHASSPVKPIVSLSFGLACMVPKQDEEMEKIIEIADKALYKSKHLGRDQIQIAVNED